MRSLEPEKPKWKSSDCREAVAAARKVTNPEELSRMVKEAQSQDVISIAAEKLEDQELLFQCAMHAPSHAAGYAADKLTDPFLLFLFVQKRGRARDVARIDDPVHIAKLAQEACDRNVRKAAIERLDIDMFPGMVERIAEDEDRTDVRIEALLKLGRDQEALDLALRCASYETISPKSKYVDSRVVSGQEVLFEIAIKARLSTAISAVSRLKDLCLLRHVAAAKEIDVNVQLQAAHQLDAFTHHTEFATFPRAVDADASGESLTDRDLLRKIALDYPLNGRWPCQHPQNTGAQ